MRHVIYSWVSRLGVSATEVVAARAFEVRHTREVFLARVNQAKRGATRVLRPLPGGEVSAIRPSLDRDETA